MDAKDLRTEAALGDRSNDGNTKYTHGGGALPCHRNKTYQEIGSNSLGKVDVSAARPCAVIGPDRVVPPPAFTDAYLKKGPTEPWLDSTYRRPPDYPHKLLDYQHPTRNISPRQTFQENMQRIMVPPTYNVMKAKEDNNFEASISQQRINKTSVAVDSNSKYCNVPYSINSLTNDQKNVRNPDASATNPNINSVRSLPHGWPSASSNVRPTKSYPQDIYQYPDYSNCAGPRPMIMSRTHRTLHEEPGPVYAEGYYHDGSLRFKPYPPAKERYPQSRYEFVTNYSNAFHPTSPFPSQKYELQKPGLPHPYPGYPPVPIKYLDRMPEPIMNGYQRPPSQQPNCNNLPYRNQVIHPNYGPIQGTCLQANKLYPYPPDNSKAMPLNKLPYDSCGKIYSEYENSRNKGLSIPDGYYINEAGRPYPMKSKVLPSNYTPNVQTMLPHPYYRKESVQIRGYEYPPHFRNMDPMLNFNGNPIHRFPPQFSPSAIAISPSDSNTSNDTNQTHTTSQEDCGYVSQSSTASARSIDSGANMLPPDMYRRYEHRYSPLVKTAPIVSRHNDNRSSNVGSRHKKDIDVRQFLTMWNEGEDDNGEHNNKEAVTKTISYNTDDNIKHYEPTNHELYVLGLVNVPSEELGKYEHIQKVSKLPENIKGYNSIELLHQFEEVIESSNLNNFNLKSPTQRNFHTPIKGSLSMHGISIPSRPLSPLDVEAKISQSVIHKEVGCNFEIKPCSPKMLNVDVATPVQTVFGERVIEKVSNPLIIQSPILQDIEKNRDTCNIQCHDRICESPNVTSCKMVNTQFTGNDPVDSIKNNYSFQDLESNSGVCLASLPRLDNDIELNFPEVNQQFINANKVDSVITATALKDLPASDQSQADPPNPDTIKIEKLKAKSSMEKDLSKLSKYRKIKKKNIGPHTPESKIQALRKDSVIIKNPDNNKRYDVNMEISPKDKSKEAQNNPINLSVATEHRDCTSNFPTADSTKNKHHEFAIDFSLNSSANVQCKLKNEHHVTKNILSKEKELNTLNNHLPEYQMIKEDATPENKTIGLDKRIKGYTKTDNEKELSSITSNVCVDKTENEGSCVESLNSDIINDICMNDIVNEVSCKDLPKSEQMIQMSNIIESQTHESIHGNVDKITDIFVDSAHPNEFESTFSLSRKLQVKDSLISGHRSSKETDMFSEKVFAQDNEDVTMNDMNSEEIDTDIEYKSNETIDSFSKIEVNSPAEAFDDSKSIVASPVNTEVEFKAQNKKDILETSNDELQEEQNLIYNKSNDTKNVGFNNAGFDYNQFIKTISYSTFQINKELRSPRIQKLIMHLEGNCHVNASNSTTSLSYKPSSEIFESSDLDRVVESRSCDFKSSITYHRKDKTLDDINTPDFISMIPKCDEKMLNLDMNDHLIQDAINVGDQVNEITLINLQIKRMSNKRNFDVSSRQTKVKICDNDIVQSCKDDISFIPNLYNACTRNIDYDSTKMESEPSNNDELSEITLKPLQPNSSPFHMYNNSLQVTEPKQSISLSLLEMRSKLAEMDFTANLNSPISDLSDDDSEDNAKSPKDELSFCSTIITEITKEGIENKISDDDSKRNAESPKDEFTFFSTTITDITIEGNENNKLSDDDSEKNPESSKDEPTSSFITITETSKEGNENNKLSDDDSEKKSESSKDEPTSSFITITETSKEGNENNKLSDDDSEKKSESSKDEPTSSFITITETSKEGNDDSNKSSGDDSEENAESSSAITKEAKDESNKLSDDEYLEENTKTPKNKPTFYSSTVTEVADAGNVESNKPSVLSYLQLREPDSDSISSQDKEFGDSKNIANFHEDKKTIKEVEEDSSMQKIAKNSYKLNLAKSDLDKLNSNNNDYIKDADRSKTVDDHYLNSTVTESKNIKEFNGDINDSASSNKNYFKTQLQNQESYSKICHDMKNNGTLDFVHLEVNGAQELQNIVTNDCLCVSEQINNSNSTSESILEASQEITECDQMPIEGIHMNDQLLQDSHCYFTKNQKSLKRSFSDSALNSIHDNSAEQYETTGSLWPNKRKKVIVPENNDNAHSISENLGNLVQNFRRNSISSFQNGENVSFCILIEDDNCIITEDNDETEKLCFTEVPDDCLTYISNDPVNTVDESPTGIVSFQEELNADSLPFVVLQENKSIEESWVDDIACVETVVTDDIAENIVISASTSPKYANLSEDECDDSTELYNVNEHTEKLKYIYGDQMCSDNSHFVETLYRTPQMNVDKTLNCRESHITEDCSRYYDKESLEKVLSEPNVYGETTSNFNDFKLTPAPSCISSPAACDPDNKENLEVHRFSACTLKLDMQEECSDNSTKIASNTGNQEKIIECKKISPSESNVNELFLYKNSEDSSKYTVSSSPEVSSTTSEERNSGIYLKISNLGGSRVSHENYGNSICCKYTEKKDYLSSNNNLPTRTLLTKAAQKYIPPIKETIPDLKIKLSLPQDSLIKLKQLKVAKETPNPNNIYVKKEVPKKTKPKFEDVLMSIDEIQFQKHKEKIKKVRKSIPKVVIKKTENGSHYASTSNRDKFNPDLTGRKWQPWVFLEKNNFIDKMAIKRKTQAIFSHRKKTYVLAEKFQAYKSIGSTKFVITQPQLKDSSSGQLKYTIKLKHNY